MKKIILMAIMVIISVSASAQFERGSRWGLTLPLGLSSYSDVPGSDNVFVSGMATVYEYNFTKNIFLESELGFNLRGTRMEGVDGNLSSINTYFSLNLGGRIILSEKAALYGQAGAFGALAVKPASVDYGYFTQEGSDWDWGLSGRIGVEISKIQLFGGYEHGMYEVWDNSTCNTIVFGLGYMF